MKKEIFSLGLMIVVFSGLLVSQNDSLKQVAVDSTLVKPVPINNARASRSPGTNILGQFLFGSGFSEDRGMGVGARATYAFQTNAFVGAIFVLHMGPADKALKSGYGTMYYLGGELGGRIVAPPLSVEPLISIGQAVVQMPDDERVSAMQSKLYLAPGISVKTLFDASNVGIHFRYIIIDPMAFFAIYLSYGV